MSVDTNGGFEMVRVSREMITQLSERDSAPVVIARIERYEDGTLNLILRTVEGS